MSSIDKDEVKMAAAGRWREILVSVGGISSEKLNGRNQACPKCGGSDRFRAIDLEAGALLCNQCFNSRNGDGLAAAAWLLDIEFPEAVRLVADHLGIAPTSDIDVRSSKPIDLVGRLAAVILCPRASLIEYGAEVKGDAVVFPVFGPDRQQCSEFSIWPMAQDGSKQAKGLLAKGKPSGIFLPLTDGGATHFPVPGKTWVITEGVKDAAALHGLDYFSAGMNGEALTQKFVPLFRGVDGVIVPDRTTSAEEKAQETAARLAGVAKSVRIATLPLPLDGDRGDDTRDALKQQDGERLVRECIDNAPEWKANQDASTVKPLKRLRMDELVEAKIKRLMEHGEDPTVPTGIAKLDRILRGGFRYGQLVSLCGLPSHLKSGFCQQIGHNVTTVSRLPFGFISLEMDPTALAERTIQYASDAPQDRWAMLTERLEEDTKRHFANAAPFEVVEGVSTLEEVEQTALDLIASGVKVVAVDYCQMILTGGRDDPNISMRKVSGALKRIAKDHGAVIIALAQLRKSIEERKPLIPRLTDIEYGPKLGQDSDVCIFCVWPHRIDPKHAANEYQIFVEKNRNGQAKVVVNCRLEAARLRISESAPEYEPTPEPEDDRADERGLWDDWNAQAEGRTYMEGE